MTAGSILFISSIHAVVPVPTSLAYNAAKAGMDHMSATMARELAEHRIRANVIEPGWIDTPGERQYATDEEIREGAASMPWGRLGTIQDIGRAAAFLCSDAADYVTGLRPQGRRRPVPAAIAQAGRSRSRGWHSPITPTGAYDRGSYTR